MDQDIDPIDIENIRDSHSSECASLPSNYDPGSEREAYQGNSPNRSWDLGSEPEIPQQMVD